MAKTSEQAISGQRREPPAPLPYAQGATPRTRLLRWLILLAAALVPWGVALVLWLAKLPLGMPDRFVYLYSPRPDWRRDSLPAAFLLAAMVAAAVWLAAHSTRRMRRLGLFLAFAALIATGFWSYLAPPDHLKQHVFNAQSPSQDGAFLREAWQIPDLLSYLRGFAARAQRPPAEMRGTRVISNPPLATVLAYGAIQITRSSPTLRGALVADFGLPEPEHSRFLDESAAGLLFFIALTALWLLSALPWYGAARLFFDPAPALAVTACCIITPMTLLFAPGKDAAQLLTVGLPLWLWLRAYRGGSIWAAGAAGALFVAGVLTSLVHIWITLIVMAATLIAPPWSSRARGWVLGKVVLPAACGAALLVIVLRFGFGIDLFAIVLAVSRAQAAVTRGPDAMPLAWQALGLPLFLLFAGPALWSAAGWLAARRREPARPPKRAAPTDHRGDDPSFEPSAAAHFGRALFGVTILVMLATVGFTNVETPRLWIPFAPLLLLALALQPGVWPEPRTGERKLLAATVFAQIALAALFWVLMDIREAETRLLSGSFFW